MTAVFYRGFETFWLSIVEHIHIGLFTRKFILPLADYHVSIIRDVKSRVLVWPEDKIEASLSGIVVTNVFSRVLGIADRGLES